MKKLLEQIAVSMFTASFLVFIFVYILEHSL